MNISEFLEERIAEDEAVANMFAGVRTYNDDAELRTHDIDPLIAISPTRILAECAAKRAVIALKGNLVIKHGQFESYMRSGDMVKVTIRAGRHVFAGDAYYPGEYEVISWDQFMGKYTEPNDTLKVLAAVYSTHPDFNPEWSK